MDHPCHRCGATLEEGVPFCSQCGAPQIRVTPPASADLTPATPPLPPGTPYEIQPPAQPVSLGPVQAQPIDWSQALPAAALAGSLIAIGTLIPIVSVGCCLWMLLGGALSVVFYRRRKAGMVVTRGMGARLGLVTGLLGFFIYAFLEAIRIAVFRLGDTMRSAMRQAIERSAAQSPDPRAQEILQWMLSPAGLAVILTIFIVMFFLAFLVFSAAGGALGAALWGQKETQ